MLDFIIIGAGAIGCMVARTLSQYKATVLVLEKQNDVGNETSSANSAIVHSGYDPIPNTNKAIMNVRGNELFERCAKELDVPFQRLGSITVALDESQMQTLKDLQIRAKQNGVPTELLFKEKVHELEPNLTDLVVGGLLAPTAGIVDPFQWSVHAMENAIDNGVELQLSTKVQSIEKKEDHFLVNEKYEARCIINCAGLYSDEINQLVNPNDHSFEIIPRKGEYLVIDHLDHPFVTHTLFMVPSEKGKGVLVSPTTSWDYLVGPSADVTDKSDNATDALTISDIKRQANLMVKDIPYKEVIRTFAGVRATPTNHDFTIGESETKGFFNVGGIESPGLASSPAIAEYVVKLLVEKYLLQKKEDYNPYVRPYLHTAKMTQEQKEELYKTNHDFGKIICKCEKVTKGEILDALNRSCPPHSVKGVKRRLRAGFGRCQGGMCQGDVVKILADFYGVDPMEVPYDDCGSYLLFQKTKGEQ